MLILNQNRDELLNLDNILFIDKIKKDGFVTYEGFTIDDYRYTIGTYKDTPEHEDQLERIAQCVGAASVYKMPEE